MGLWFELYTPDFVNLRTKEDLVEAIQYAWDKIGTRQFRTLICSMSERCMAVIERGEVRRGADRSLRLSFYKENMFVV